MAAAGRRGSTSFTPSSSTCPPRDARDYVHRLLADVVAPDGRLIVCGYGSPRSGVRADPVCDTVRGLGFEPELQLAAVAPEGGGAIVELAALSAR